MKRFKTSYAIIVCFIVLAMSCTVFAQRISISDGEAKVRQVRTLTFTSYPISISEGGTGTNGFGGVKIFPFKEGYAVVNAVMADLNINIATNLVNDGSGINFALGTATAIATEGATNNFGTRADFAPNVEVDPWTNGVTRFNTALAAQLHLDGTATAKDIYANVLVDDADISTNVTAYLDGWIRFTYDQIGDYTVE